VIAHWDDVTVVRRAEGHICGDWQYLTGDESVTVGARRLRIPAGSWSTPLHLEGSEEEIFFVLDGTGVSLQQVGNGDEAIKSFRRLIKNYPRHELAKSARDILKQSE